MAKMVSMNASVIAVKGRNDSSENFAFEAVASQIMEISESSLGRISGLREILDKLDSTTAIINKAGRQRMLSQRYMKLILIIQLDRNSSESASKELTELKKDFEKSMDDLIRCPLNTEAITSQLLLTQGFWECFLTSINRGDITSAAEQNETVLIEMNKAVMLYEGLVRGR